MDGEMGQSGEASTNGKGLHSGTGRRLRLGGSDQRVDGEIRAIGEDVSSIRARNAGSYSAEVTKGCIPRGAAIPTHRRASRADGVLT